ncbi:MAG: single-stranded DNA-binding protein [Anaerolineae bacterium]|jgi:single-strand DNA-binding protein|nr:single-stranded DNA-binding protein [Anaerolineae bacterium]
MYQKTVVIGHLGKDPEMRYTPSGVPVTSFNIATTRKWTNANGEQQEKTTWFRVTCWRKTAELAAQYLQKGRLVLVEGDIEASAWTDKEGAARASLELTATTVKFLGGRGEGGEGVHAGANAGSGEGFPVSEDDIPF